jgi:hypothetical protein
VEDGVDSTVAQVYVDGAWSADSELIDASFPPWRDYDPAAPVTFRLASGRSAWTIPGVYTISDERFQDAFVGGVALVRGCTVNTTDSGRCPRAALLGLEADTGVELWRREGNHDVFAAADGLAIVSVAPADGGAGQPTMIDLTTGDPVAGQTWTDPTFFLGCCANPEFTIAEGGVVLTSDGTSVDVYVPAAAATPTVEVEL